MHHSTASTTHIYTEYGSPKFGTFRKIVAKTAQGWPFAVIASVLYVTNTIKRRRSLVLVYYIGILMVWGLCFVVVEEILICS